MAPDRLSRMMHVDDHEIVRDGLREVLQRAGDFEVVGQAGDGEAAVRVAQSLKPDVIIMDVMMPLKKASTPAGRSRRCSRTPECSC